MDKKSVLFLFTCMGVIFCFGSVPVFLKYLSQYLDAYTLNSTRYLIGAGIWFPFIFILKDKIPPGSNPWKDALLPFVVNILGQTAWGLCPFYNDASIIGFGMRSTFFFTLITGLALIPSERILVKQKFFWIGSVISIVGVVLLSSSKSFQANEITKSINLFGIFLILSAALFYGMYSVLVHRNMNKYPARLSFAIISLYTSVGLLIEAILFGDFKTLMNLNGDTWILLILSALIGISIAHVLLYRVIQKIGALTINGIMMLVPLVTFVLAYIFLGERLIALQWFGGGLLIIGAFGLIYAKKCSVEEEVN
ncbi:MAG: hypothetical protein COA79_03670 [Planctomycetota bacterium]|nr:MAG: hypothetical protein COA79_03670 [Planctomycetota bacterium]